MQRTDAPFQPFPPPKRTSRVCQLAPTVVSSLQRLRECQGNRFRSEEAHRCGATTPGVGLGTCRPRNPARLEQWRAARDSHRQPTQLRFASEKTFPKRLLEQPSTPATLVVAWLIIPQWRRCGQVAAHPRPRGRIFPPSHRPELTAAALPARATACFTPPTFRAAVLTQCMSADVRSAAATPRPVPPH